MVMGGHPALGKRKKRLFPAMSLYLPLLILKNCDVQNMVENRNKHEI